jgi:hypothetical protein
MIMRKWSEAKKSRSRWLNPREYPLGEKHRIIVTDVTEEEFERNGKTVLDHVLTLTRPGIGSWGCIRVNVTNGDILAGIVGDDFTKAIGQQFMLWTVATDFGPGWRIGPVDQQPAQPAMARPSLPLTWMTAFRSDRVGRIPHSKGADAANIGPREDMRDGYSNPSSIHHDPLVASPGRRHGRAAGKAQGSGGRAPQA